MANYLCKVFLYDLLVNQDASVTDGQTDGRTDERQPYQ